MDEHGKLNASLQMVNPDLMRFNPSTGWRRTMRDVFFVFCGVSLLLQIIMALQYEDYLESLMHGDERIALWGIILFPFIFLGLWLIGPIHEMHFDRSTQTVHIRSKKRHYSFKWDQVVPTNHWTLIKTGRMEWLSLRLKPPFPKDLERAFEKKGRPPEEKFWALPLGTIIVESPEHAMAMFAFLDTWMRSHEPAGPLYLSMVKSRFSY